MEVADNARKHGVVDLDIEHVVRNAIRVLNQGDHDGQLVAIHAMALRPKFYEHL